MPFAHRKRFPWQLRTKQLPLGERTLVMAILNLTPDSFSGDGMRTLDTAVRAAASALAEGADILDLGAESTRPGAAALSANEEMDRLLPMLEVVRREHPEAVVSVDTYHAETAKAAVGAGAEIVNDVSGLTWDPAMAGVVAKARCGLVLMHTYGHPQEWKTQPRLGEHALAAVIEGLRKGLLQAQSAGIGNDFIVLDPGFGFGKLGQENLALLARFDSFAELGRPLLAGLSRKGFLGGDPAGRLPATIAASTAAILAGAHILRVHDVAAAQRAAEIADAVSRRQ